MNEIILTVHPCGKMSYGFSVSRKDREQYFDKEKIVTIELPVASRSLVVEKSFNTCGELIKKEIKVWLEENGYIPYKKNFPPKIRAGIVDKNRIRIIKELQG